MLGNFIAHGNLENKDYFQHIQTHVLEPLKRKRTVYLLYKDSTFQSLAKEIAKQIKAIIRHRLIPDIQKRTPELAQCIYVNDD